MICLKKCGCMGQGNKDILMIGYESKISAEEMHARRIERRTLHGWLRQYLPLLHLSSCRVAAMGGPRFP